MGFNKKYLCEETIRIVAKYDDYVKFFNHFKSPDAIISLDKFSSEIYNEICKLTINDKDKIIKILNKCK